MVALLIIHLRGPRVDWELVLWACLGWENTLIILIEACVREAPPIVGSAIPGWGPGLCMWRKGAGQHEQHSSLFPDCRCGVSSGYKLLLL